MHDDGYTTPEGFYLARPLLLPEARSFSDVLEYLGEWDSERMGWQGNRRPALDAPKPRVIEAGKPSGNYYSVSGQGFRTGNELGPYCAVRTIPGRSRSMAVRATDAVIEVVAPRIVTPDDALSFEIIGHRGRDRALVVLNHGYIIGSHWLAYIDPATIPAETEQSA